MKVIQKSPKVVSLQKAFTECEDVVISREKCWNNSPEGKHTESCFVEELAEKKCLSYHLCPIQFRNFYEYTDCHLWAEAFAHKDDEQYVKARARISSDRAMTNMCREIVQDLSKEMSKYTEHKTEALKGLKKESLSR